MRGFDVVQKGSATSLLRNSNYIYFKSVPRAFISFKKKKKNKDLYWFDFHHITQFLCTEYYDYSNAGNWQLHDKAAVAENTTPCWGSESKAITGGAVQDLRSPFQVSVMLHNNLPLHPSNSKQSKETVYLKRYNTTYRSTPSTPIILRSSTDHILV